MQPSEKCVKFGIALKPSLLKQLDDFSADTRFNGSRSAAASYIIALFFNQRIQPKGYATRKTKNSKLPIEVGRNQTLSSFVG